LQGARAVLYARALLAVAEGVSLHPRSAATLGLFGPKWRLEERISGLLDPRRNRMTRISRWKWGVTVAALATFVAGVRVVAATQNHPSAASSKSESGPKWRPFHMIAGMWHHGNAAAKDAAGASFAQEGAPAAR
jgi:hypothetical protein